MSMILKSYEEGKIPLEEWTDDMLATLPGWSGWQHCNYNCSVSWTVYTASGPYDPCVNSVNAGDVVIRWSPDYGCQFDRKIIAADVAKLPLIAGKPFIKLDDGRYYIKGSNLKVSAPVANQYDLARCDSIPGA